MDLRPIPVGSGFEDGINFHDQFDKWLVEEALDKLYWELSSGGHSCYCLELRDAGEETHFRPLGTVLGPHDTAEPPSSVPLRWLVPDLFTWPVLAVGMWASEPTWAERLGLAVRGVKHPLNWHAQIRVQRGRTYAGYFKITAAPGTGASAPPDDRTLQDVFYTTKLHVRSLISDRAVQQTLTSKEFQDRLQTTKEAIAALKSEDRSLALKHVADLLTSHLGAGWNRAACYCPADKDTLRCLWAQGGDGRREWCARIQRPLGERVRDMRVLVEEARRHAVCQDDAYSQAAAGRWPVEVRNVRNPGNHSVLAQLWCSNGDIRALPWPNWAWELCDKPLSHMTSVDRHSLSRGGAMAAMFDTGDPWVDAIVHERPDDRIFCSQNEQYWAVPWFLGEELIAIWVVDIAYWGVLDHESIAFPSFVLSDQILRALAPAFESFRQGYWGCSQAR